MLYCWLFAIYLLSSMTQSCTDALFEAKFNAENLVSNQSGKSFGACIVNADLFSTT